VAVFRTIMKYCKVEGCRFAFTHTTSAHICGTCTQYGHGQVECGRPFAMRALQNAGDIDLPLSIHCTVPSCSRRWTHTTDAHFCQRCRVRGECQCVVIRKTCPMCRKCSDVDMTNKIFTGADCIICFETKQMVVFSDCRHAVVCAECTLHL
jgi:hypothetical protein